jgi:hypothetical protein
VARTPFTARALREFLFCLIEVPLGLCVLLIPAALVSLPLTVSLLTQGGQQPASPAHPHRSGAAAVLGLTTLFMLAALVALVLLAPLIGRGLGTAHRRLAGRLLGERIPGPAPIRRGGGLGRRVTARLRDGPGWRAAGYLLLQLPFPVPSPRLRPVRRWWPPRRG